MQTVEYRVSDHVGTIAMNRPERHNALGYDLLDDLDEAFDLAEADDAVRVVVLQGNGPSFCSGYDLKGSYYIHGPRSGVAEWNVKEAMLNLRGIEARYMRIWNFPKPTVAKVHGYALAGGCYLQMLCDVSVAAEDAVLGHPAMKRGGVSSMPLWQVLLGPKKARYLLMTGRTVDGREAERIGLVSLAAPRDRLDETVAGIAADIAAVGVADAFQNKEALNTLMEIQGLGAMFRYAGQMNSIRFVNRDKSKSSSESE
ncbi:MAG: enoyl-CoA hydratase/isomerase family protein [Proteobacteria bacterium]|nr:enoyl-CoA hydratase/isomerase family protein [Pseudomonadota bacterium]